MVGERGLDIISNNNDWNFIALEIAKTCAIILLL